MPARITYHLTPAEVAAVGAAVNARKHDLRQRGFEVTPKDEFNFIWRTITELRGTPLPYTTDRDYYAAANCATELVADWRQWSHRDCFDHWRDLLNQCERDHRNAQTRLRYANKQAAQAAMWVAIGERDRAIRAEYEAARNAAAGGAEPQPIEAIADNEEPIAPTED